MATLAEAVGQGAQDAQNQAGHSVGDALNAYQISAQAEHARQELDMEKQKQDMNKATWFSGQMDNIQRMEDGPARKLIINSVKSQMPSVYPGFNPDNFDLITHRPELTPALAQMAADAANGKNLQPGDLETLMSAHGSDFMKTLQTNRDAKLQEIGNQTKNMGMVDVRQQMVDLNTHKSATDAVTKNTPTQNLLNGYQSMQNALTEFKNNPSPQSFHTLQNVARMNAGSSNRSGVAERADQYATDLGIKKDEAMQLLTGKMQDVNLNSPDMVGAISKVYDGELALKQKQADQATRMNASKYNTFYQRPSMQIHRPDFESSVDQTRGQFDLPPMYGSPQAATQPASGQAPVAQAPAPRANPYGATPKEIEANYQAFLATKAHQQASGGQ